ncbi:hypothetical protein A4_444 [Escherichia phage A4]|nr:hypothetical protein A4_444 [Escherichia phage A4]
MILFFALYGVGVLSTFLSTFLIINWGSFKDTPTTMINISTCSMLSVLWPVSLVYLFISICKDFYDTLTKFKKKKHDKDGN